METTERRKECEGSVVVKLKSIMVVAGGGQRRRQRWLDLTKQEGGTDGGDKGDTRTGLAASLLFFSGVGKDVIFPWRQGVRLLDLGEQAGKERGGGYRRR